MLHGPHGSEHLTHSTNHDVNGNHRITIDAVAPWQAMIYTISGVLVKSGMCVAPGLDEWGRLALPGVGHALGVLDRRFERLGAGLLLQGLDGLVIALFFRRFTGIDVLLAQIVMVLSGDEPVVEL